MNAKRNSLVIIYQIPTIPAMNVAVGGVVNNAANNTVLRNNIVDLNNSLTRMTLGTNVIQPAINNLAVPESGKVHPTFGVAQPTVGVIQPTVGAVTNQGLVANVGIPQTLNNQVVNPTGAPAVTQLRGVAPTTVGGMQPTVGVVNNLVTQQTVGMGRTWGVVNIIDGKVIIPTTTFDDPIYTYEGDLLLDYSYFVNENNVMKPIRSANMVEPVDVNAFRLVYNSRSITLTIDNERELTSSSTRMPSVLAVVHMLAQRGYIDVSYSNCVSNYCAVFDMCLMHGVSLQSPLKTGTAIINTDRKSFHTIDPTKWDVTSVADIVIPYITREFYIMNIQTGVHKVIPIDKFGIKWCVIETTWGEKYEVLWEALVIYVEKLFTKL